jgi:hypothetical protein
MWTAGEPEPAEGLETVTVPFESDDHPGWVVRVTVARHVRLSQPGGPTDLISDRTKTDTPLTSVEVRHAGSADVLPTRVLKSLPLPRMATEAGHLAADVEYVGMTEPPPLPPGGPVPKRDNTQWYLAFNRSLRLYRLAGYGGPVDIYREVARRKRVSPETVKGWAARAAKVVAALEADADAPTPVATCASCNGPIFPGAVGRVGADLFHPSSCAPRRCERLWLDQSGRARPLSELEDSP